MNKHFTKKQLKYLKAKGWTKSPDRLSVGGGEEYKAVLKDYYSESSCVLHYFIGEDIMELDAGARPFKYLWLMGLI